MFSKSLSQHKFEEQIHWLLLFEDLKITLTVFTFLFWLNCAITTSMPLVYTPLKDHITVFDQSAC